MWFEIVVAVVASHLDQRKARKQGGRAGKKEAPASAVVALSPCNGCGSRQIIHKAGVRACAHCGGAR